MRRLLLVACVLVTACLGAWEYSSPPAPGGAPPPPPDQPPLAAAFLSAIFLCFATHFWYRFSYSLLGVGISCDFKLNFRNARTW